MAAKKFVLELLGADGKGVAGVAVKASGCSELATSPLGTALFLTDEATVSVTVEGKEVFNGAQDSIPERLVLVQNGGGWKRK
jgi:hypothetical protein